MHGLSTLSALVRPFLSRTDVGRLRFQYQVIFCRALAIIMLTECVATFLKDAMLHLILLCKERCACDSSFPSEATDKDVEAPSEHHNQAGEHIIRMSFVHEM